MEARRDPYKVPVQTSKGIAGTAVAVGWKIIEENGQMYFVPDLPKEE